MDTCHQCLKRFSLLLTLWSNKLKCSSLACSSALSNIYSPTLDWYTSLFVCSDNNAEEKCFMKLTPDGSGAVFLLVGGVPAGDNIVRVNLWSKLQLFSYRH